MIRYRLLAAAFAALLAGAAWAQDGEDVRAPDTVDDGAYRVGSGDVLQIDVYDDPDLSGLVTIQHGGEISFPLLGEVPVEGLTVKEVQSRLTELLAKDYLVDPQVMVRVKEHRSQWVTLVGEVVRPGKYYLQGTKTLLDLLTEGGGFTTRASGEVLVSRLDEPRLLMGDDGPTGDGTVRIFLSPEQSAAQQKEALSLRLTHGDIVTATATQSFFVSGEVKNPGSYPLSPGLTVLQAVSVAGGLSKFGSKGKVEILRKKGGDTKILRVDLGDIENGKTPDVLLEPEDIVKVGKRVF